MNQLERDLAAARVAEDLLADVARRQREFTAASTSAMQALTEAEASAAALNEVSLAARAEAVAKAAEAVEAVVAVTARQAEIETAVEGHVPAHQWNGYQLRIRNPDGGWGGYVNLRGAAGAPGETPGHEWDGTVLSFYDPAGELAEGVDLVGPEGPNGWSPIFAVATDGERRVLKVGDWTGGAGTKPDVEVYLGAGGFTTTIGDAVNVRGATGASGAGSGDMNTATYDPNEVQSDAFDMDNMEDGATKVAMLATERTKLAGIATGATANSTDAALRARADHTGEQAISTVTGLQTALDAKAPLASPTFTGIPAAPTPATSDESTKVATTAYVKAVLATVLGTPPSTLDTLHEIATALNNDPDFAATMTTALAGKLAKSMNLSDLPNVGTALDNLGFSANAKSLIAAANYAAMKTLLAVGVADIADASVNGRSLISAANYAAMRTLLGLDVGTDVQAYSSVLAGMEQSFTTALKNKLDAIEASADVTDQANVAAAGAAMLATEDQSQTGGVRVTIKDLGNLSGASITLDPGDRPHQKITNNGAGTLTAGSNYGDFWMDVHNTTGAGALTIAGLTSGGLLGDELDTTTTSIFQIVFSIHPALKTAYVTKIA